MTTKIKTDQFTGTGHVFNGTLAAAVRGLAQNIAAKAASGVDDFAADNSGGTATTGLVAVAAFTLAAVGTDDCVAKAEAETTLGGVRNGLSTLLTQVNLVNAKIGLAALTDSTGGTSGTGTIAAIDDSATGAGSALMAASGGNAAVKALRIAAAQVAYHINEIAEATAQTKLTDATVKTEKVFGLVVAAVSVATGTAVDGSDALAANAAVKKADWDAKLDIFSDNIASMAAKLDAVTAAANANAVCTVVAN
jgi:hypothetical protein